MCEGRRGSLNWIRLRRRPAPFKSFYGGGGRGVWRRVFGWVFGSVSDFFVFA